MNLGWLRQKGEKLYAYSSPDSIIMNEDTGKTLRETLSNVSLEELYQMVLADRERIENLQNLLDQINEQAGVGNVQVGSYAVLQSSLNTMNSEGSVDPVTEYKIVSSSDDQSWVTITIKWKSTSGVTVKTSSYYTKIGTTITPEVFGIVTLDGIEYDFPVGTPIYDLGRNAVSRQVLSTSGNKVTIRATKSVVLVLKEA